MEEEKQMDNLTCSICQFYKESTIRGQLETFTTGICHHPDRSNAHGLVLYVCQDEWCEYFKERQLCR